jgi:hypothetical protein
MYFGHRLGRCIPVCALARRGCKPSASTRAEARAWAQGPVSRIHLIPKTTPVCPFGRIAWAMRHSQERSDALSSQVRNPCLPVKLRRSGRAAHAVRAHATMSAHAPGGAVRKLPLPILHGTSHPLKGGTHMMVGAQTTRIVPPDLCDITCNERFAPNKPLFTRPVSRLPVSAPPL